MEDKLEYTTPKWIEIKHVKFGILFLIYLMEGNGLYTDGYWNKATSSGV